MAVFKQELNWSSFQNTQMKILESIDKSLNNNLQIGKSLANNLNKIEYAITSIAYATENSAKNIVSMTKEWTGTAAEFKERMQDAGKVTREFSLELDETSGATRRYRRELQGAGDSVSKFRERLDSVGSIVSNIFNYAGGFSGIGQRADKFSASSNQMIKLSGMSGDAVKEFRSEITSIVANLNTTTGSLYSPQESYEKIVAVSQGINSNLEAMEEMTRPLLLSYETLDANLGTVANTLNRFYTRYNFSSLNMEDTLDAIRGNTAGNSASAESTFAAIEKLDVVLNGYAKDDNNKRESVTSALSGVVSWIESMGMESNTFTDAFKDLWYGNYQDTPWGRLLSLSGTGIDMVGANKMLHDNPEEAFGQIAQALLLGIQKAGSQVSTTGAIGPALQTLSGLDADTAVKIYQQMQYGNITSLEAFLEAQQGKSTMEQLAEDKYVSAADKANHWLEHIYKLLADVQETLGFGFTDIAIIAAFLRGTGLGRSAGSLLGSTGNAMVRGSRILGGLSSAGYNLAGGAASNVGMSGARAAALGGLGIAGIAGGVGFGIDGILGAADSSKTTGSRVFSGLEAGAGIAGAGLLGASALGLAATGPAGWIALAGAGVAFATKKVIDAATKVGSVEIIEAAYEDAAKSLRQKAREQKDVLTDIKIQLKEGEDLESIRNDLINSGILNDKDREDLLSTSTEDLAKALDALTEKYWENVDKWSVEARRELTGYEREDKAWAKDVQKGLAAAIGDGDNLLSKGITDDVVEVYDQIYYTIYDALKQKFEDEGKLSGTDNKLYKELTKVYEDMDLSSTEASNLGRSYNLSKISLTPEQLQYIIDSVAVTNKSGAQMVDQIMKGVTHTYTGTDEATKIIGEKYGIPGYADGSNYIEHDQLAMVHAGEAIVPKKYNPAVNNARLAEQVRESQEENLREMREAREYLVSFVEEVKEIKEFLQEWKSSNDRNEKINQVKSKYLTQSKYVNSYMKSF